MNDSKGQIRCSLINVPNTITAVRVVLAVVVAILLIQATSTGIIWAGILLLVAWGTDGLDGFLARKLKQQTLFGSLFDLVADRCIMTPALIITIIGGYWQRTAGLMPFNPYPYAVVVFIADITVLVGVITLLWKRRTRTVNFPPPTQIARISYSVQMPTLVLGVWGIGPDALLVTFMYLTIIVTVLAFYTYLKKASYVFTS